MSSFRGRSLGVRRVIGCICHTYCKRLQVLRRRQVSDVHVTGIRFGWPTGCATHGGGRRNCDAFALPVISERVSSVIPYWSNSRMSISHDTETRQTAGVGTGTVTRSPLTSGVVVFLGLAGLALLSFQLWLMQRQWESLRNSDRERMFWTLCQPSRPWQSGRPRFDNWPPTDTTNGAAPPARDLISKEAA